MAILIDTPTSETLRYADNTGTVLEGLTAWTAILWTKTPATMSTFQTLVSMSQTGGVRTEYLSTAGSSGANVRMGSRVSYSGTDAFTSSGVVVPPATWVCLASSFDSGASAGDFFRQFYGTLTSAMTLQSIGLAQNPTGTIDADGGSSFDVGDPADAAVAAHAHQPAKFILYNTRLTNAQIIAHQWDFRIKHAGCVVYYEFGLDGVASVQDLSGNGINLTVVNTPTVADHVPLGPPFGMHDFSPYFVAGGGGATIFRNSFGTRRGSRLVRA